MPRLLSISMTCLTAAAVALLWTVPAASQPNQDTPRAIPAGSGLFNTYCVACHGANAKGNGALADSLKKRPADLTQLAKKNNGVFPREMVAQVIDGRNSVKGHGGGDMPVWGEALLNSQDGGSETVVKERIGSIVTYLETLQVK